MRNHRASSIIWLVLLACAVSPPGGGALAQEATFEPLLAAREVTALLELDGQVLAGLDGGGMLAWPVSDPAAAERWYAGDGLSGNTVADLVWSGRHVWVATRGGGLTRIADPGTAPQFRQYTSNLGGMDLTAVAGALVGGSERVYYAMAGAGLGQIIDGLSGNIYTAEQDGLIDNDINAMAMYGGELFIATPSGVSRFRSNIFTDQNEGLPLDFDGFTVNDLAVGPEGDLWAACAGGIFSWDPVAESWTEIQAAGFWIGLAGGESGLYALRQLNSTTNAVFRWNGTSFGALTLPRPRCAAVASGEDLWIGGRSTLEGMNGGAGIAYYGRRDTGGDFTVWEIESSLVQNAEGVAFAPDGSAWIGSHVADAVSGYDGSGWSHIYRLTQESPDGSGLFNYGSNILAMAADNDGMVWVSQYTTGLIRHDPATGLDDHVTPANSGLSGAYVLEMVTHPEGPLVILHDIAWGEGDEYPQKVDVLLDPAGWDDPGNWVALPVDEGGLTSNNRIWAAVVERPDVIWFAAEDYGLVRWDVNGGLQGPEDPLTWDDFGDDRWDGPLASFTTTNNDPRKARGLALAPDGTIWCGGNGLIRFSYDELNRRGVAVEYYSEKTGPSITGLVSASVSDVAVDANGHLWAATSAGLNRVRRAGGAPVIDAWIDLGNYFANPSYPLVYSANVISPLPGGTYRDLALSPDGKRLLLSSDGGACLVSGGTVGGAVSGDLAGVFCYPNPWTPGAGEGLLKLGGLPADETGAATAAVDVFNLEGQLVHRNAVVEPDEEFWDGKNRVGENASSGMYVVKVTWAGRTTVIPVAVVR
ncbi:MAG: hypothetical protein ABIK96_17370 [bacterium]